MLHIRQKLDVYKSQVIGMHPSLLPIIQENVDEEKVVGLRLYSSLGSINPLRGSFAS